MSYCALKVVLDVALAEKRGGSARWLPGKTAVQLDLALGTRYGCDLGLSSHAALALRTECPIELVSALRSGGHLETVPVPWLLEHLEGRPRYEALRDGGRFGGAPFDDLRRWLSSRPLELWYATRSVGYSGLAVHEAARSLPLPGFLHYLETKACTRREVMPVLETLSDDDLLAVLTIRDDIADELGLDWIVERFADRHEDDIFELVWRRADRVTPNWLADELETPNNLLGCLACGGHLSACSPEWLVQKLGSCPNSLYSALQSGGHLPGASPWWLCRHLEGGSYLLGALEDSGRIGEVSPDWLAEHLEPDVLLQGLSGAGHLRGGRCGLEWLADHLPVTDLAEAVFEAGLIRDCTPDWIAANVPESQVFHTMAVGGHMASVDPDWIVQNIAQEHRYRALLVYGHLEPGCPSAQGAWIYEHLEGKARYKALRFTSQLTGDEDLGTLRSVCDGELLAAMQWEGRIATEPLRSLRERLDDEEMYVVLTEHQQDPDRTAEEYAAFLAGWQLVRALQWADLVDTVSLDWLVERLDAFQLADIIADTSHVCGDNVEALAEMLPGNLFVHLMQHSGLLRDRSHVWLAQYLTGSNLALALHALRDLQAVDPVWIVRHVDPRLAGELIRMTSDDVDPDLLRACSVVV